MKAIFNKQNLIAIGILMLVGLGIFIFSVEKPTVKQKVYSKFSEDKKDRNYFYHIVKDELHWLANDLTVLATEESFMKVQNLEKVVWSEKAFTKIDKKYKELELKKEKLKKVEYILHTSYKDTVYIDLGSFHYIDSIKCIRYNEMLSRVPHIDTLEARVENLRKRIENQKKEELEKLNKSCK